MTGDGRRVVDAGEIRLVEKHAKAPERKSSPGGGEDELSARYSFSTNGESRRE